MGTATSIKCDESCFFFFAMLHDIRDAYPIVYGSGGSNKPRAREYKEFKEKWGLIDTIYQIADKKIEKVAEIYQIHLNDFLQYLSYTIEEQRVDEIEDKYQDQLRRAKRGR